jgi:hypothetical protein
VKIDGTLSGKSGESRVMKGKARKRLSPNKSRDEHVFQWRLYHRCLWIDNAAHPWLERSANVVEEVGQRTVERGLWHVSTRGANVTQFAQVGCERVQGNSCCKVV